MNDPLESVRIKPRPNNQLSTISSFIVIVQPNALPHLSRERSVLIGFSTGFSTMAEPVIALSVIANKFGNLSPYFNQQTKVLCS